MYDNLNYVADTIKEEVKQETEINMSKNTL